MIRHVQVEDDEVRGELEELPDGLERPRRAAHVPVAGPVQDAFEEAHIGFLVVDDQEAAGRME